MFEKIYIFISSIILIINNIVVGNNRIEGNKIDKIIGLLIIDIIIIISAFFITYIIPKLRMLLKRKKIDKQLKYNRYILYYQPIYDPIKEVVVGFESLLRLKDKNNNLISPERFIPEIDKNNMMADVTIWIMKRVITDYKEIKNYNCIDNNFYISLNLSIDEILNNKFVDEAIEILKEANLENKSICLEIVEKVGIKNLHKIMENLSKLKNAGFKIAIDDFGTEYSNLDVLEKLDADIIKVDKNFVDGLGKHLIKDEIILFILRIAEKAKKYVVLEGVENKDQDNIIKSFNSKYVFVQGFFYSKPMPIEDINKLF
ncbi:EAL domain-containing protein [Clostridium nigeriense]|uniref:EAL domain-containing protein n=1 Tax=Clostridium nigeriense TaxID=1805470 RepID=UPI003D34B8EE